MGRESVIEWTDSTWNPWRGCTKVSPGCAECYMFRDQLRYGRDPSVVVRCSPATFYAPLSASWEALRDEKIMEKGSHLVFTCSWSDWFHEDADPWREEAWGIIRDTPRSTYQILTKRPERILSRLPEDWGPNGYQNVWLGVSIENRRFIGRADLLREVPARVRFISAEPLLGPLVPPHRIPLDDGREGRGWVDGASAALDLTGIDWLIVGGESGGRPGRRLTLPGSHEPSGRGLALVRDLRDACRESGTAFLLKQWGGPTPTSGGRMLDGQTYDEMPRALTSVR